MIYVDYIIIDRHCIRAEAEIPPGEGVILRKLAVVSKRKSFHDRPINMEKMRETTLELIRISVENDAAKR